MAAKDYVIVKGWYNAFLTKKLKSMNHGVQLMSKDRRPITEDEMIGLFEFYLRNWCDEHEGEDTVVITDSDGKKIFEATLLDKEDRANVEF